MYLMTQTNPVDCIRRTTMNAEEYLKDALGGNMNISTLKPKAWHDIMEGYAKQCISKLGENCKVAIEAMVASKPQEKMSWKTFSDLTNREKWNNYKEMKGAWYCPKCGCNFDVGPTRADPFSGASIQCSNCDTELTRRTGGGQSDPFRWVFKPTMHEPHGKKYIPQEGIDGASSTHAETDELETQPDDSKYKMFDLVKGKDGNFAINRKSRPNQINETPHPIVFTFSLAKYSGASEITYQHIGWKYTESDVITKIGPSAWWNHLSMKDADSRAQPPRVDNCGVYGEIYIPIIATHAVYKQIGK